MENFDISPGTRVAHINLNVNNIKRSIHFYETLLGFKLVRKTSDGDALLSIDGSDNENYLIILSKVSDENRKVESKQSTIPRAGLFHFAILLPSRDYLANIFKHLSDNSDQFRFEGAADHLVSESLYLRDPDSNGLEIYRDRNESEWERFENFQVRMSTEYLDLDQLYSEGNSPKIWRMPPKTVIGHVHLHVSNLVQSKNFYSDILGLHHTCRFPRANFFAAGSYHHHIATNTWLGTNIDNADTRFRGLNYFALRVDAKDNFEKLEERLRLLNKSEAKNENEEVRRNSIPIQDPDKINIQIYH
jgi:catechol 2,3-dioxygenase